MSVIDRPPVQETSRLSAPAGAKANSSKPPQPKRGKGWLKWILLAAAVTAAAYGGYVGLTRSSSGTGAVVLTYKAVPETFDVKIPLSGELKAIRNVEVRSMVEGVTTILWLIPEGSRVKEGDLLARLASDQIKDKLEDFKIRVENDEAAVVNSQQLLEIQINQNESDITAAETNATLAQLEYDQFIKGDAIIEHETRKTALANAVIDLDRKTEDLKRVRDLKKLDYVSGNDVLDAEIAYRDADNKLKTSQMNVDVWSNYAERKQLETLTRKKNESAREMARAKKKAEANRLLRDADLRAKKQTLKVDRDRLEAMQKQLDSCEIKAPGMGMVVYQSSVGGWNQQGPIEEGAQVRLNQTLFQLPDLTKLQAEVRLAEQMIERVQRGQEATVTVDAFPGKIFHGKVDAIATLPDNSNRWNNPNLKEYITQIPLEEAIDQTREPMKPGMTTKVEILVRQISDAIAVPSQAVFSNGGKTYVFVGDGQKWEKRTVTCGMSSATKVEITSGVKLGDTVLLSRPTNAPEDMAEAMPGRGKKKRGAATAPAAAPAVIGAVTGL